MNSDLENKLEILPELVSKALLQWRKGTLEREKMEATLYLFFKGQDPDRTATEIKALVHQDQKRYEAILAEASFESVYTSHYESLLAAKHLARMREAF